MNVMLLINRRESKSPRPSLEWNVRHEVSLGLVLPVENQLPTITIAANINRITGIEEAKLS